MQSIKRAFGIGILLIFISLTLLLQCIISISYYYLSLSEARKLANTISYALIVNREYDKYLVRMYEKADFSNVTDKIRDMNNSYVNSGLYVLESPQMKKYNLLIEKSINVKNSNRDRGVPNFLVNDCGYISEGIECCGYFTNISLRKIFSPILLKSISNEKEKSSPYLFYLPNIRKDISEQKRFGGKIENIFPYNKKNEFFKINKFDLKNDKRPLYNFVIDIEKTKKIIIALVNDYNEKVSKNKTKFTIIFADCINCFVSNNKKEFDEKVQKNEKSFFFFADVNKGKINKLDYRIQDKNLFDNSLKEEREYYYPFYSNSIHLVINFDMPFFKQKVKYHFDFSIDQEE